jgi:hypothetical protein
MTMPLPLGISFLAVLGDPFLHPSMKFLSLADFIHAFASAGVLFLNN